MIPVLVADDQALVRAGFVALIDSEEGMRVVAEAADGEDAVRAARRTAPRVAVMDVRMPGVDGIEATRRICADPHLPDTRILVVTTFDLDEYVYAALRAGASGFLLKDTDPADLLRAIRVVAAGDALLSPGVTRRLIAEFATRREGPSDDGRLAGLTGREAEILALVARGLSNQEIAARLVLSPFTVKTHVSRILGKLGCRDRAQLVALAYETGLVTAGDVAPEP